MSEAAPATQDEGLFRAGLLRPDAELRLFEGDTCGNKLRFERDGTAYEHLLEVEVAWCGYQPNSVAWPSISSQLRGVITQNVREEGTIDWVKVLIRQGKWMLGRTSCSALWRRKTCSTSKHPGTPVRVGRLWRNWCLPRIK